MRKFIRSTLIIIGWCAIFIWLLVASLNETVSNVLVVGGAVTVSMIAIWLLAIFIEWLAQPDPENKNGDNSVDEKAGGGLEPDA